MLPSCQRCLRKKPFFGEDRFLYGDLVHRESPDGLFHESKTRLGRTAREKSIFSRSEARATALSEDSFLAKVGSRLQRAYPSAQDWFFNFEKVSFPLGNGAIYVLLPFLNCFLTLRTRKIFHTLTISTLDFSLLFHGFTIHGYSYFLGCTVTQLKK